MNDVLDMLDRGPWHVCTEDREECSALWPNGGMRITVFCECGRTVREYIDWVF